MGEPDPRICSVFVLFADWCVARGHVDLAKRDDCPTFEIEGWKLTLNPSALRRRSGDHDLEPYSLLVISPGGWPGVCNPYGGAMMAGMEDDLIDVLERAIP